MKYKLLKDLYDCFCTPPELQAQKQEIEECHQALSKVLGKLERRLVLQIIDAKDRIAEETSIDSFIAGFELAWKLSVELNHYENERSVSCQTAMGSGARFASKEEEKYLRTASPSIFSSAFIQSRIALVRSPKRILTLL